MENCNRCNQEYCDGLKNCESCGEDMFCTENGNICDRCDDSDLTEADYEYEAMLKEVELDEMSKNN